MKCVYLLVYLSLSVALAVYLTKDNLESICQVTQDEINCNDKSIANVAKDAFVNYGDKILTVSLAMNSISKLDPGSFASLSNLMSLSLNGNKLTSVPNDLLQSNKRLRYIFLSSNLIESFDLSLLDT